jgi:hypothetical protein
MCLALEAPHAVTVKLYKFYSDLELDMAIMEDEEAARSRLIEADADKADTKQRTGGGSCDSKSLLGDARSPLDSVRSKRRGSYCRNPNDPDDANDTKLTKRTLPSPLGPRPQAAPAAGTAMLTADNLELLMARTNAENRMHSDSSLFHRMHSDSSPPRDQLAPRLPRICSDDPGDASDSSDCPDQTEAPRRPLQQGEHPDSGSDRKSDDAQSRSSSVSSEGRGRGRALTELAANNRLASLVFVDPRRNVPSLHEQDRTWQKEVTRMSNPRAQP